MGGIVTIWALHLPEGAARDARGFVGIGGPCASQKATAPEFPVTSVLHPIQQDHKQRQQECVGRNKQVTS
jgi:hypothetical protein